MNGAGAEDAAQPAPFFGSLKRRATAAICGLALALGLVVGSVLDTAGEGGQPVSSGIVGYAIWGILVCAALLIGLRLARWVYQPVSSLGSWLEAHPDLAAVRSVPREFGDDDLQQGLLGVAQAWRQDRRHHSGKVAFVAALVHDVKTQLAGVKLLHQAVGQPNDGLQVRERASAELDYAHAWLATALHALRLDSVESFMLYDDHRIDDICREVARTVRLEAGSAIAVSVEGTASGRVDVAEFRRALHNLVANAVRAARSQVSIEVFPGLVRIADDGPGLPAPFDVLSQPFRRVEVAQARTTSGTGLGLFIARRILELHGGRLVCERTGANGTVLLAFFGG